MRKDLYVINYFHPKGGRLLDYSRPQEIVFALDNNRGRQRHRHSRRRSCAILYYVLPTGERTSERMRADLGLRLTAAALYKTDSTIDWSVGRPDIRTMPTRRN